jgi:folate-binding protein YgfZ
MSTALLATRPPTNAIAMKQSTLVRWLDAGLMRVTGADRWTWLNAMVTCDLARVEQGRAHYALFAQKNGKIVADAWILAARGEAWVVLPKAETESVARALDHYLIMEDAELHAEAAGWSVCVVLGRHARRAAELCVASEGAAGTTERCGHEVAVLVVRESERERFESRLLSECEASVLDDADWCRLRVELGWPERGVDFDAANYPQEAALERDAVSFDKGCYLGQEAIFMLEKRGRPSKRLVQLRADAPLSVGAAIESEEGSPIGTVTSAAVLPAGPHALGIVRFRHARPGTAVMVGGVASRITDLLAPSHWE